MAVYGALMINTQYNEYKIYGFGTSLDKVFWIYGGYRSDYSSL